MFEIHRCGARSSRYKWNRNRRKGKPQFKKIKDLDKFYTQLKEEIISSSDEWFRAELFAKKYQCKVHFVTQVFARLNREGILTKAKNSIHSDGCWTASIYEKVKPPEPIDPGRSSYYNSFYDNTNLKKRMDGREDDETGYYIVTDHEMKTHSFYLRNPKTKQWEERW